MDTRLSLLGIVVAVVVVALSTAVATSAFSATTLDRDAAVTVTTDRDALVGLVDGHPGRGLVEQSEGGRLVIDFARAGGGGANRDAVFRLGAGQAATVADNHAFRFVNRGSRTTDLTVQYTLSPDSADGDPGKRNLRVQLFYDADGDGTVDSARTLSEQAGDTTATVPSVGPGESVYVSVVVDTKGLSTPSDLTGRLGVKAASDR
ncbi:MAG: hypothetical protein ABEH77_06685 [Halobacteriaceae archaeon]